MIFCVLKALAHVRSQACGGLQQKCCLACPSEIRPEGELRSVASNTCACGFASAWTDLVRDAIHVTTAWIMVLPVPRVLLLLLLQSVSREIALAVAHVTCLALSTPKQQMAKLKQT